MAEVIYYWFEIYGSVWDADEDMVDGDEETYANTADTLAAQDNVHTTCSGEDLGTITKVEVRAKGYIDTDLEEVYDDIIKLQAFEHISDLWLDEHEWLITDEPAWSDWIDITSDTNAPDPWTWEHIEDSLHLKVTSGELEETVWYCSKMEVRVTYTTAAKPTVTTQAVSDIGID